MSFRISHFGHGNNPWVAQNDSNAEDHYTNDYPDGDIDAESDEGGGNGRDYGNVDDDDDPYDEYGEYNPGSAASAASGYQRYVSGRGASWDGLGDTLSYGDGDAGDDNCDD